MKSWILSAIITVSAIHAYTQNVSFDSTFGTDARTFTQNGNPDLNSADYKFASYQPGGSFFLAGSYGQTDTIYFVTKFKSNGTIDNSFGVNGKLFVKKADFGISTVTEDFPQSRLR